MVLVLAFLVGLLLKSCVKWRNSSENLGGELEQIPSQQKSRPNPRYLILVLLLLLILAILIGGIVFFKTEQILKFAGGSSDQDRTDTNSQIKTPLASCFGEFGEKLAPQKIGDYIRHYSYPDLQPLDTSAEAPVSENGSVKKSLYIYYSHGNIDTKLDVTITEFLEPNSLEILFSNIETISKDSSRSKKILTNSYTKEMRGQKTYFMEQQIEPKQFRFDIYTQIPERTARIHFVFIPASSNYRRVSSTEAESVFVDWLNKACP